MQLADLQVLHLSKKEIKINLGSQGVWPDAFYLETCQRWLWVGDVRSFCPDKTCLPEGLEVYQGARAYLFLLRLASGLESEIVGETDIFGQLKQAWSLAEGTCNTYTWELSPWMQKIFEDTKEIRSRYLQNLGGSSYGSLVRKLIRTQKSDLGPILLVGAGQIAHSIAPYLLSHELWLWNRTPRSAALLHQSLSPKAKEPIRVLQTQEEERQGWKEASNIVVCIPFDPQWDKSRIELFRQGNWADRSVIHLGGAAEQSEEWNSLPRFYGLNDIFALQNELGNIRTTQIAQARKACEEKASFRELEGALSISQKWKDLACLA